MARAYYSYAAGREYSCITARLDAHLSSSPPPVAAHEKKKKTVGGNISGKKKKKTATL